MNNVDYYCGLNLEQWLEKIPHAQFPAGYDYYKRYSQIKDWMVSNIYDEVKAASLYADKEKSKEPKFLNNHGKEHVECVIERALALIKYSCEIDAYQVYILLVAILIHDAGNLYGREDHQIKCAKILYQMGDVAGQDSSEKRIIAQIAQAHGGCVQGNKDTISGLPPSYDLSGKTIHPQFLAAILRFADELADDAQRATRFMLEKHLLGNSEIYHAYSNSLKSVIVESNLIKLRYELLRENLINKITVDGTEKYLIDEIYARITKLYLENRYCLRYIHSHITGPIAEKINVRIDFWEDYSVDKMTTAIKDHLEFTIEEKGYPSTLPHGIVDLCPDLKDLDGAQICKSIQQTLINPV